MKTKHRTENGGLRGQTILRARFLLEHTSGRLVLWPDIGRFRDLPNIPPFRRLQASADTSTRGSGTLSVGCCTSTAAGTAGALMEALQDIAPGDKTPSNLCPMAAFIVYSLIESFAGAELKTHLARLRRSGRWLALQTTHSPAVSSAQCKACTVHSCFFAFGALLTISTAVQCSARGSAVQCSARGSELSLDVLHIISKLWTPFTSLT